MTSFPDKSNSEHGTLSVCNSAKIRFLCFESLRYLVVNYSYT